MLVGEIIAPAAADSNLRQVMRRSLLHGKLWEHLCTAKLGEVLVGTGGRAREAVQLALLQIGDLDTGPGANWMQQC